MALASGFDTASPHRERGGVRRELAPVAGTLGQTEGVLSCRFPELPEPLPSFHGYGDRRS